MPHMSMEQQTAYEESGIQVIELDYVDPHYKTDTFIVLPDGKTLADYPSMHYIPDTLYDYDDFAMPGVAIPGEMRYEYNNFRATIWDGDNPMSLSPEGKTLIAIGTLALIYLVVQIIGAVIILYCIYRLIEKILAPCGSIPGVQEINDCWKLVTKADCSQRTFNSCGGPDENGDGVPEIGRASCRERV